MLFTQKQIQYDYDKSNDILYCSFADKSNSYGDEDPDGIVIMRDIDSNNVTGITVFHIIKMLTDEDSRLLFLEKYIDYNVLKQIFEHIMVT